MTGECGYVRPPSKPRLRLVRVDPMDPAQVVPWGAFVRRDHVVIEARRLALGYAKEGLRRQGLRPQYMEARELSELARAFFEDHRAQLLEEACDNLLKR